MAQPFPTGDNWPITPTLPVEQDREGWGTPAQTFQENLFWRVKNPKRDYGAWCTRLSWEGCQPLSSVLTR
jgi:hypothetical protein